MSNRHNNFGKPLGEKHRQAVMRGQQKRTAVIEAAVAFVLNEWSEMQEMEGTTSLSIPVEYMNLHHAVCEFKGWKPFGNHPQCEEETAKK